ncbi:MAG: c-type cytochrome [Bacteroidota bacterium]|nr:c-type cytochrome [Bacteroidota bacterium]
MKKIILRIVAVLGVIIIGLVVFIFASWDKKFDAPFPDIKASKDSAVIARGRYLAFGPAHCGTCHVPMEKYKDVENGEQIPLSGGWELSIPPGTFRAPNLTPDMETGIGKFSDGEIARALRHSVKHDGSIMFPFMPFQDISDDDLTAIVSFLKSQPAVKNELKKSELTFLGKAIMAFGGITPTPPMGTPPKSVVIDTSKEYGSYLANSVANCVGCHTERDLKTGKFTGRPFAGGLRLPPDPYSEGYSFMTPNITPDKETSIMAAWDEQGFVDRFKTGGRIRKGSPMPWGAFSRMNEMDIRAIYRYIHTVDAVNNKISKVVFAPGEKFPD